MTQRAEAPTENALLPAGAEDNGELPLKEACEQFERQYVIRVLARRRWNISRAARVLRVHRNTILRKLSAWGLERPGLARRAERVAEGSLRALGVAAPHEPPATCVLTASDDGQGQAHPQSPKT